MKILQTFDTQIGLRSSVSKSTTVFILTLFIFFNTANFSLASPGETSRLMRHAANLSQNGKNEEALKIFLKITRKEPNNFYAHNNLGMVYSQMQKNDKALNAYEKSLSINPTFPMTLNNIGSLHMTMGHYDKAEMFLKKASSLFGSFHLVSTNLGELYFKQKLYRKAMTYLKKSLKDMPTFPPTHRLLGELHQAEGRMDEAEKEFILFKELKQKSK